MRRSRPGSPAGGGHRSIGRRHLSPPRRRPGARRRRGPRRDPEVAADEPGDVGDRPLLAARLDPGLEPAERRAARASRRPPAMPWLPPGQWVAPPQSTQLVAGRGGDQDLAGVRGGERRPQSARARSDRRSSRTRSRPWSRPGSPGSPSRLQPAPRRSTTSRPGEKRSTAPARSTTATVPAGGGPSRTGALHRRARVLLEPREQVDALDPAQALADAGVRALGATAAPEHVHRTGAWSSGRRRARRARGRSRSAAARASSWPSSSASGQRLRDLGLGVVGDQDHRVRLEERGRGRRRRRRARRTRRRRGRSTRPAPRARSCASGSRCRAARRAGSRRGRSRRARDRSRPSSRRGSRAERGSACRGPAGSSRARRRRARRAPRSRGGRSPRARPDAAAPRGPSRGGCGPGRSETGCRRCARRGRRGVSNTVSTSSERWAMFML